MRKAWKRLGRRVVAAAGLWGLGVLATWAALGLTGDPGHGVAAASAAGFLTGAAIGLFCASIASGVAAGDALVDVWDGRVD